MHSHTRTHAPSTHLPSLVEDDAVSVVVDDVVDDPLEESSSGVLVLVFDLDLDAPLSAGMGGPSGGAAPSAPSFGLAASCVVAAAAGGSEASMVFVGWLVASLVSVVSVGLVAGSVVGSGWASAVSAASVAITGVFLANFGEDPDPDLLGEPRRLALTANINTSIRWFSDRNDVSRLLIW